MRRERVALNMREEGAIPNAVASTTFMPLRERMRRGEGTCCFGGHYE
jgi:hypothetical protein